MAHFIGMPSERNAHFLGQTLKTKVVSLNVLVPAHPDAQIFDFVGEQVHHFVGA